MDANAMDYYCYPDSAYGGDGYGITVRIVGCVKKTVFDAVSDIVDDVTNVTDGVIQPACYLLILISGLMVMGGNSPPYKDLLYNCAKVAFVVTVSSHIAHNFETITNAMDDLIDKATFFDKEGLKKINPNCQIQDDLFGDDNKISPVWFGIDCALDTLIGGLSDDTSVSDGVMGFLVASLFSGAMGAIVAVLGAALVFLMLFALSQCLYVYITAIVAIALLIIVSPLFIPCILFNGSRNYFNSWCSTLFNYIMQPVVLFAYLSMLLVAMGNVIFTGDTSIYKVATGSKAGEVSFGQYMSGSYVKDTLTGTTLNVNPSAHNMSGGDMMDVGPTGKQVANAPCSYDDSSIITCLGVTPNFDKDTATDKRAFFEVDQPITKVDWGRLGGDDYLTKVLVSFLSAALTAYIFLELLKHMPYIGAAVSGGGVPVFGTGNLSGNDNPVVQNVKSVLGGFGK